MFAFQQSRNCAEPCELELTLYDPINSYDLYGIKYAKLQQNSASLPETA